MLIKVNGKAYEMAAPLNMLALVESLQLNLRQVAMERNGEIVPRSRFPDTWLADGDKLEIVVAVGGG